MPPEKTFVWERIDWPFLRDAWPPGLAVRCTGGKCGTGVDVYIRPKLGFCNCATGVSDDYEVDNVSDLDLISEHFTPSGDGHAVVFGPFKGRARSYHIPQGGNALRAAHAVALASGCDLIVAGGSGDTFSQVEDATHAFLSAPATQQWISTKLGLR